MINKSILSLVSSDLDSEEAAFKNYMQKQSDITGGDVAGSLLGAAPGAGIGWGAGESLRQSTLRGRLSSPMASGKSYTGTLAALGKMDKATAGKGFLKRAPYLLAKMGPRGGAAAGLLGGGAFGASLLGDGVQGQGGYNYQTPDWLQGANDWVNDNIPEGFGQVGDFIKNLSPEWKAGLGVGVPMAALLAGRFLTGGRR